MKQITNSFADKLAPAISVPNQTNLSIIPSYAAGSVTASQSGNLITVTFTTPHNIGYAAFHATYLSTTGGQSTLTINSVESNSTVTSGIAIGATIVGTGIPTSTTIVSLGTWNGSSGNIVVSTTCSSSMSNVPCLIPYGTSSLLGYGTPNFNVSVFLNTQTGVISPGWYTNFTVTSPTTFTCTSPISQTVNTQPIYTLLSSYGSLAYATTHALIVPPNTLGGGSSMIVDAFIHFPSIISRGVFVGLGTYYVGGSWYLDRNIFGDYNVPAQTNSAHFKSIINFLDNGVNSNFQICFYINGVVQPGFSNSYSTYPEGVINQQWAASNTFNIQPSAGFTIVPTILFQNQTVNDFVIFSMLTSNLVA